MVSSGYDGLMKEPLSQVVRQGNRAYPTSPVYDEAKQRLVTGVRKTARPSGRPIPYPVAPAHGGAMRQPPWENPEAEVHVPVRQSNPECPVSDTYADGVPDDSK